MDQLKGSLRFISLPALAQFLVGLGSTGRLRLAQGTWRGELALHNGRLVAARLGSEQGRAALDGMLLALHEAEFVFVDEPVEHAGEPLLVGEELATYIDGLDAERQRLQPVSGALGQVPVLVDHPGTGSQADQVTIEASALRLIPSLVFGHTLEQIARQRGMASTLRQLAPLLAGGLVRLEPAPPVAAPVPVSSVAAPVPAPRFAEQLVQPADAPAPRRNRGWRQSLLGIFLAEPQQA
jgi:Domain of unknown function (DUF4388)